VKLNEEPDDVRASFLENLFGFSHACGRPARAGCGQTDGVNAGLGVGMGRADERRGDAVTKSPSVTVVQSDAIRQKTA
jgi:hypothetical protein